MPSTFTWLDYSEHERRKMLDFIELFGEKTTRDELGLGGVRDAFADLPFPGTTTIQPFAKYFLFVPWMFIELERRRVDSSKVAERARKFEIDLAKTLGAADGVIGKRTKDSLNRLPSSVYWHGLMAAIAQEGRTPAANPKLKPVVVQCQRRKRNHVGPWHNRPHRYSHGTFRGPSRWSSHVG